MKFQILQINQKIEILNQELLSANAWENMFYRGQFDHEVDKVKCIEPCRSCYVNWFEIPFNTFDKYRLDNLVNANYLFDEEIEKLKLSIIVKFGGMKMYKTVMNFSANYTAVLCENCQTKHLLIMGLGETQPGLYAGHLQGVWKIK